MSQKEASYEHLIALWNNRPDVLNGTKDYKVLFTKTPLVYEPNIILGERLLRGESVGEKETFSQYFARIQDGDPEYWNLLGKLDEQRQRHCLEAVSALSNHRLQVIVPVYREGENVERFLLSLKQQFEETPDYWGVTFVINHEIPYKNPYEASAARTMEKGIKEFLDANPQFRSRVDYVSYTTRRLAEHPILPTAMARKVGEDLTMLICLRHQRDNTQPLYLGQVDMDVDLPSGIIQDTLNRLPNDYDDIPVIIRAKGSINRDSIKNNPHLSIFEMVWEEGTSSVAQLTQHNPFAIGRFGIFPAREYALAGGGLPRQLDFYDEDVRKNIQIAWKFPVKILETDKIYATSSRREINLMNRLRDMAIENNGKLTVEMLETAAMIRLYNKNDWATHDYRESLGNVNLGSPSTETSVLNNLETFSREVPSQLIETMVNSWCQFTLFSMFAIDELWKNPDAKEVWELRNEFLSGGRAYLDIQLKTYDFLRKLSLDEPERFQRLQSLLKQIDQKARLVIRQMLTKYQILFTEEPVQEVYRLTEVPLGVQHDKKEDDVEIYAPFHILPDQREFTDYVRQLVNTPE